MFLLQRAKALQQANPALKALADLQGKNTEYAKNSFWHLLAYSLAHQLSEEKLMPCV